MTVVSPLLDAYGGNPPVVAAMCVLYDLTGAARCTRKRRNRMIRSMSQLAACGFCLFVVPAVGAAASAPQFVFHKGEKLTYTVSQKMGGAGKSGSYSANLNGKAVLRVLSVQADGTAKVEMTTTGSGRMASGGESMALTNKRPQSVVVVVKPNGAIAQLLNAAGKQTSFVQGMADMMDAGALTQVPIIATYALFGLCLPDKLPGPGGKWTGYHQSESATSPDGKTWKAQLKRTPVSFKFLGQRNYKGQACLAFAYVLPADRGGAKTGIPTTAYFDAAKGRLVALESKLSDAVGTVNIAVVLTTTGKTGR
jgi:hypothetical protein